MGLTVALSVGLSEVDLELLSTALLQLRLGRPVDRAMAELVLHISPLDSFAVCRARYRAITSAFCRKSAGFDHVLYGIHRGAWDVLRNGRR